MTKPHDRLTKEEERELNHLMDKYKNDDEFFAHMNRQVTTFMLLGGVRVVALRIIVLLVVLLVIIILMAVVMLLLQVV